VDVLVDVVLGVVVGVVPDSVVQELVVVVVVFLWSPLCFDLHLAQSVTVTVLVESLSEP
jgi:hypothetical protein